MQQSVISWYRLQAGSLIEREIRPGLVERWRDTSRSPARVRPVAPRSGVEVQPDRGRFEVHLFARTRAFLSTVGWGSRGGLESGGWLYGERFRGGRFDVVLGVGPGPNAEHGAKSFLPDWGEADRLDERVAS